uniref:hypothetical protein n=1 Tax=Roseovarius sp. BRH_c41 TaxID=1629709 RepID=UPI000A6F7951|nr:hypothetical protein [Roseovarius sp. BRH_c41]
MSIWYRTGTISITSGSAALTGSGTAWLANAAPGMMVVRNGVIVGEVLTVNSNTSITLAVAYTGTTISGGSYAIANLGAVRAGLIAAFNDVMSVFAAAQAGPLSGRFGDGTLAEPGMAFLADLNTGFRRPAADQIGMVTGGVQRALLSSAGLNAITNLLLNGSQVFARSNILGTVTQSAGVPTGALIESVFVGGNGEYTRFANGTQICATTVATSDAGEVAWTYPAEFAVTPRVAAVTTGGGSVAFARASSVTTTTLNMSTFLTTNARVSSFANIVAVGRWF